MPELSSLPIDILIIVLETLGVQDLTALSLTCHAMYAIVS